MLDWLGDYGLSITVDDVGTLLEYVGPDGKQWSIRDKDLRACIKTAAGLSNAWMKGLESGR